MYLKKNNATKTQETFLGCTRNNMHSLEANASPAGRFCRRHSSLPYFGCFSIHCWGRISPNINVATLKNGDLQSPAGRQTSKWLTE